MTTEISPYLIPFLFGLIILVFPWAFVIPVGLLIYYRRKKKLTRTKRFILIGLLIGTLAFNPILHIVCLGPLNRYQLNRLLQRAETYELIGKTENVVIELFGEPHRQHSYFNAIVAEGGTCCDGPFRERTDYATWYYRPIPFYMFSQFTGEFEVQFTDGKVEHYGEPVYLD